MSELKILNLHLLCAASISLMSSCAFITEKGFENTGKILLFIGTAFVALFFILHSIDFMREIGECRSRPERRGIPIEILKQMTFENPNTKNANMKASKSLSGE